MKITKEYLKQIIKEELEATLKYGEPLEEAGTIKALAGMAAGLAAFCGAQGCATVPNGQGGVSIISKTNNARSIELRFIQSDVYSITISGISDANNARDIVEDYIFKTYQVSGFKDISKPKRDGKDTFTFTVHANLKTK